MQLSIIIPHYNSPKSLDKLLGTIPVKDNIEIIVIDDKSDKNIDVYKYLLVKYENVKFIYNDTEYKGAGVCRNIGIKNSIGKYILFADADDFFVDNFYDYVEKYFELDNDIVYFIPDSVDMETGEQTDRHLHYKNIALSYKNNKDIKSELILKYKIIVPWSKLIKRELIIKNNIEFDKTIVSNDVMFSVKASYFCNKIDVSDDIIYCVTKSKGSLTRVLTEKNFDIRLSVFIDYHNFLKNNLSEKEFNLLDIKGIVYIYKVMTYNLGFKKVMEVYKKLKENNIKILSLKLLNPIFIINKLNFHIKSCLDDKKYNVRE